MKVTNLLTTRCVRTLAALVAVGGAAAVEIPKIDIHGAVSLGYAWSDEVNYLADTKTDGSFQFNEFMLNFGSNVTDRIRIATQIYSRDLGPVGNNEVVIDYAYGQYTLPILDDNYGIRVGRVKNIHGFYNDSRDVDQARTWILMPQSVYDETFRDFGIGYNGIQLYGNQSIGPLGDLDLSGGVGHLPLTDSFNQVIANPLLDITSSDTNAFATAAMFWNTPLEGLRFGASIIYIDDIIVKSDPTPAGLAYRRIGMAFSGLGSALANPNAAWLLGASSGYSFDIDWYTQWILGAEYRFSSDSLGDFTLAGEYFRSRFAQNFSDVFIDYTVQALTPGWDVYNDSEGGYISGTWRFHPKWEIGSYYSVQVADPDDRDGSAIYDDPRFILPILAIPRQPLAASAQTIMGLMNKSPDHKAFRREIVGSVRFDPYENLTLKLEGHFSDGTSGVSSRTEPNQHELPKHWIWVAVKATFAF